MNQKDPINENALKDPVCGMNITQDSTYHHEYEAKKYYFCSQKCQSKFISDPKLYILNLEKSKNIEKTIGHHHSSNNSSLVPINQKNIDNGTLYTCPMHPEIRQDHPGNCPKCGMALEPLLPELEEEDNPELRDFKRRFWWTLPLTIIVTFLAMFGHQLNLFDMTVQSWIELVLSIPVVLWAGWPFFLRGWQSVINHSPNMWTLISLGTGAAFIYSVVATVTPEIFPNSFVSMGRVAVYFEAAVVIISLTLLGQVMELKARSQTSAAIKVSVR